MHFNEAEEGVYWFHLVSYSVRPSVHLSISQSVDRIMAVLYLQQYSPDPFHAYTTYQATSDVWHVSFSIFKIKKSEFLANSLNL